MDNISFTFVSAMAALGGAMGTFVGFQKLADTRQNESDDAQRVRLTEPPTTSTGGESSLAVDRRPDRFDFTMRYAHDFARTVGYLGMHSIYGMVVYPWMPLYLLGSSLRKDAYVARRNK